MATRAAGAILIALVALGAAIAYAAAGGNSTTPCSSQSNTKCTPTSGGNVTISLSTGTAPVIQLIKAAIGDSASGSTVVTNTGQQDADVTLTGASSTADTSAAKLLQQLQLTVYARQDNTGTPVFRGTLAAFNSASVSLGTVYKTQTGQKGPSSVPVFFHVALPSAGSNALDNQQIAGLGPATESFAFTAVQH